MDIQLDYSDIIRLFKVDDPSDFAPGLELRDAGFFVPSTENLAQIVRGSAEEAELTRHPTGNLPEPILAFPCSLRTLERFVDDYGLRGSIDAFVMAKVLERRAWELARTEAKNIGQYHWPIVAGVYRLREEIDHTLAACDNDAKKVALRDVLDELNAILPAKGKPAAYNEWPWGSYETEWLRLVAHTAREWWGTYEPGVQPSKSKDVAAWIQRQKVHGKPVGKTIAKLIAQILRADGLPKKMA